MNYKIRVKNEAESKEAQGLLFELGYKWIDIGAVYFKISPIFNYITAYCKGKTLAQGDGLDARKEITIPQLRDMVVLKRNDISDATHENSHGQSLLKVSNGWYIFNTLLDVWEWNGGSLKGHEFVLWQRETLNDKVASAEVARQEFIGAPFDDLPAFNFGAVDDFVESNVEQTLSDRESTYGSFKDVADTTSKLMGVLLNSKNGQILPCAHQEALHMICSKMARIVNGDHNFIESWHDIAGYASLVVKDINDNP